MPLTDLPLDELRERRSASPEPADFDDFWARTLREADEHPPAVSIAPEAEGPWQTVEIHDVTFAGFGGHPVRAWLTLPARRSGPLPGVVEFVGYGGGRGLPGERLEWASAGYAHLLMDTRGQGGVWGSGGATPDPAGAGPSTPGFLTRGVERPEDHYYRRVFVDAIRAVRVLQENPLVDASRVAVHGGSQGGGIALAAAGLSSGVAAALIDVPFLCEFRRGAAISTTDPYAEIARFLRVYPHRVEEVFGTLSYFDGVSMAARATAPTLFSVGLMDPVCPPSTVFAAYNAYAATDRTISVYEFAEHDGGRFGHRLTQLAWLAKRLS